MRRWMGRRWMSAPVAAVMLTACVTINVYFPAAEAKEAAKEFVEKVIGDEAQPQAPTPQDKPGGQSAGLPAPQRSLASRIDWLSLVGISSAHAQGQPDINIKTPAIQAIQSRMGSRFDSQLRAHFDSGALGFANDGTIAVRDASKIPLPQRVAVNQAVAEQGRDRQGRLPRDRRGQRPSRMGSSRSARCSHASGSTAPARAGGCRIQVAAGGRSDAAAAQMNEGPAAVRALRFCECPRPAGRPDLRQYAAPFSAQ